MGKEMLKDGYKRILILGFVIIAPMAGSNKNNV
jgi:hypothetical protein